MSSTIEGRIYKAVKVRHLLVNLRDDPASQLRSSGSAQSGVKVPLWFSLEKLNIFFKVNTLICVQQPTGFC